MFYKGRFFSVTVAGPVGALSFLAYLLYLKREETGRIESQYGAAGRLKTFQTTTSVKFEKISDLPSKEGSILFKKIMRFFVTSFMAYFIISFYFLKTVRRMHRQALGQFFIIKGVVFVGTFFLITWQEGGFKEPDTKDKNKD